MTKTPLYVDNLFLQSSRRRDLKMHIGLDEVIEDIEADEIQPRLAFQARMMQPSPNFCIDTSPNSTKLSDRYSASINEQQQQPIDSFDFDLDLFDSQVPSLVNQELEDQSKTFYQSFFHNCNNQRVPSPTSSLSPADIRLHSPTMFSPMDPHHPKSDQDHHPHQYPRQQSHHHIGRSHRYSPISYSPTTCSPQQQVQQQQQHSFPQHQRGHSGSIQESLSELGQLQRRYPDIPSSTGQANQQTLNTTEATVQIKIEPVDPAITTSSAAPVSCASYDPFTSTPSTSGLDFDIKPVTLPTSSGYSGHSMSLKEESKTGDNNDSDDNGDDNEDVHVKIEPVLSLAMAQVQTDIRNACRLLNISPDPSSWNEDDVRKWLRYMMQEYNIEIKTSDQARALDHWAKLRGQAFAQVTDEEFKHHFPEQGELLHGQLDIWRSSAGFQHHAEARQLQPQQPCPSQSQTSEASREIKEESFDISYVLSMLDKDEASTSSGGQQHYTTPPPPPYPSNPSTSAGLFHASQQQLHQAPPASVGAESRPSMSASSEVDYTSETMDEDDDDTSSTHSAPTPGGSSSASSATGGMGGRSNSSNNATTSSSSSSSSATIHLWQFVKELLNQPQLYSGCIHWLDREQGVFKIVDSNRVATLWGQRKNRPAMNYDKLSRSLRQYYKKGIMKKTERTQRLVYQFCHPYHL